jgi:hypothetical protein
MAIYGDDQLTDSGGKRDTLWLGEIKKDNVRLYIDATYYSTHPTGQIISEGETVLLYNHLTDTEIEKLELARGAIDLTGGQRQHGRHPR